MEAIIAIATSLIILSNLLKPKSVISISLKIIGYLLLILFSRAPNFFQEMLIIVSVFQGIITSLYATKYSEMKYLDHGLVALIDLFAVSIILVFMSDKLLEFISFWLLTELLGFILIAFDYIKKGDSLALSAAIKYLVFSMIPTDITLFIMLSLVGFERSLHMDIWSIRADISNPVLTSFVILGFFSKAAIFPLHFWLPDAHSVAPSPASALLSGLMVKMGVYGLYIVLYYNLDRTVGFVLMLSFSLITAIYGALQASLQTDIKRLLAYSTTANTALASALLALYIRTADSIYIEAAFAQALAHAVYKATLFLDAGFVEIATGTRDLEKLGYVYRINPLETSVVLVVILGALGLPPSMGFLSKVLMFTSVSRGAISDPLMFTVLCVFIMNLGLSVIYNVRYIRAHVSPSARSIELNVRYRPSGFHLFIGISGAWMFMLPFTMLFTKSAELVEPLIVEKGLIVFALSMISMLVVIKATKEIMERGP